jgi:putative ABC transport system permease protein
MRSAPPTLACELLRLVLPREDAETIGGDLEETFHDAVARKGRRAAALWHWRQVSSIAWARAFRRDRVSTVPQDKRGGMAAFRQDVSYAVRSLRKQPGFTATVVVMLALGIGANVAIFSLVNSVLLKRLPFADPDRLMMVHMTAPDFEDPAVIGRMIWSYPKYVLFRDTQQVFESTAAFAENSWNVTGTDSPERAIGEFVEASYFPTLGVGAVAGRTFTAEETRAPGSQPLAVLGHGFWVRRFGGDPGIIGRTVGLNGIPHTIVGVVPPGFRGLTGQADVWVPLTAQPPDVLAERWNHTYSVVARRKADASVAAAQSAVTVLGTMVANEIPDPKGRRGGWGALAVPLNDDRVDPLIRRSLLLLLVAVASVLVLVCVNVGNLTLARALARQRDVAIRLALGASRLRIVRQFMTESVLLACLGAVAGVAVASLLVSAGASLMPDLRLVLPARSEAAGLTRVGLGGAGVDAGVLMFTVATALVTAALFGLGPAWRASRRDLTEAMKRASGGAVSGDGGGTVLRNAMVVGEVALALVLLTAGGLMIKSVARLQATELGFTPSSLLSARVALPSPKYTPQRATQFLDDLVTRLSARPEVTSVAYGSCAPVSGGCNGTTVTFLDRPPAPSERKPRVGVLWASPTYFDTLGVRLVRGRVFTGHDRVGQPKVVVVNEAAVRAFWGGADPIGTRIGVGQGGFGDGAEVVGVVADVRYGSVETSVSPDVYLPLLQSMRASGVIFVRSGASTAVVVPVLRSEVRALDADLPLVDVKMMRERFGDATWRTRMSAWLLSAFASLGLLLAALGVYGVVSQGVEERRREIGVRMALGAARADIFRLIIIRRVLSIGVAGIALGVLLAIPSTRALTALLYQVDPLDPVVITGLAAILLTVAVVAGYIPARRATRVDPLTTLRAE